MDPTAQLLVVGFIVVAIIGIVVSINTHNKVTEVRQEEKDSIDRLGYLRNTYASLRRELQDYELGRKTVAIEPSTSTLAVAADPLKKNEVRCFFCDEKIMAKSVLCPFCRRPNLHNSEGVIREELEAFKRVGRL